MDLSILIPTVPIRKPLLDELLSHLDMQIKKYNLESRVEVLVYEDNFENSVGSKRNTLYEKASGKYVLILDDDDKISDDFCITICNVIENHDVDQICFTLHQLNPKTKKIYSISKYSKDYKEIYMVLSKNFKIRGVTFHESFDCDFILYFKNKMLLKLSKTKITHALFLNFFISLFKKPYINLAYTAKILPIKKDIALKIKYSDLPKDQDVEWSENIRKEDLIKTEYIIDKVLEYYMFDPKNSINRYEKNISNNSTY
jgi:glycosyltransferase involved in cell wall biosynthesis